MRGLLMLCLVGLVACGSSDDDSDDLTRFTGTYPVTETFHDQNGTQCTTPPTQVFENRMVVSIDKNSLEARFQTRWDTLKGEIHENGSVTAGGSLGADLTLNLTGSFKGVGFSGYMNEIRPACTRRFAVAGNQQTP